MYEMIFGTLFKFLAGPVVKYLNKKQDVDLAKFTAGTDADKTAFVETVRANASAYHEQVGLAKERWGWWGTRYLLLAAALPPILHSGAIYLDSTFRFGWAIPRAPGVYEEQELKIIAAVVGYQVTQSAIGAFTTWLRNRRS